MWNKIKNIFSCKSQTLKRESELKYESGFSLEIPKEDLEKIRKKVYQTSQYEAHVADEHLLKVIKAFTEVCFIEVGKYSIKQNHYDSFIRAEKEFRKGKQRFILDE